MYVTHLSSSKCSNSVTHVVQELMEDPVMAADGFSYERSAILNWLALGSGSSPMTGAPLEHQHLTPNLAVRTAVDIMKRRAGEQA